MTSGSLFSGIGALELGLRSAADVEIRWLCDSAEFPRRVLATRFAGVRLYGDATEVGAAAADVEIVTAGFPCQPVSQAGLKRAQRDARWLWPEVARVVKAKRPLLLIVENVRGLLGRGLRDVLQDLAALGYDCQWDTISAYAVGAPHIRERVWIVASREPLGRVFGKRPRIVSDWIGSEPTPRLERNAPYQTARLEALGNAVVPQVASHVAISAIAALAAERWEPPNVVSTHGLRAEELGAKLRSAGALVDGHVFGLVSSSPRIGSRRLWPSPAANEAAWSLDALLACRDAAGRTPPADLLKRWYHAETGQIVQTGLRAVVQMVEAGLWAEPDGRPGPWLLSDHRIVWPTPHGISGGRADGSYDGHGSELSMLVRVVEGESDSARTRARSHSRLFPTPRAVDATSGPDYARATRSRSGGDDLQTVVSRDERDPKPLSPSWVEWMMGVPRGWTNPDDEGGLSWQ